jgi:hypothetical protein
VVLESDDVLRWRSVIGGLERWKSNIHVVREFLTKRVRAAVACLCRSNRRRNMPSISAPAFVIVLGEMALSRANLLHSYLCMRNGAVHVDVKVKMLLGIQRRSKLWCSNNHTFQVRVRVEPQYLQKFFRLDLDKKQLNIRTRPHQKLL